MTIMRIKWEILKIRLHFLIYSDIFTAIKNYK